MALAPILNKDQARKPSKLDRASEIFGIGTSLANMAGNLGAFSKPTLPSDDIYKNQFIKARQGMKTP